LSLEWEQLEWPGRSVPKRVIVIFPTIEAGQLAAVADLRRRYDPLADLVQPHITLVFPFDSEITDAELREHAHTCVRNVAPFRAVLSQVTGHEGEYLLLNVKNGNDDVVALHDLLYTGPLAQYLSTEHTFVPHMTVGRIADRQDWLEALKLAGAVSINLEFVVSEVSVYEIEPIGSRSVTIVVPLGLR
jgi:2'-5' RNA ligase